MQIAGYRGAEQHGGGKGKERSWMEGTSPCPEAAPLHLQAPQIHVSHWFGADVSRLVGSDHFRKAPERPRGQLGEGHPQPWQGPSSCSMRGMDLATCGWRGGSPGHEQMSRAGPCLARCGHQASTTAECVPAVRPHISPHLSQSPRSTAAVPFSDGENHCDYI